MPEVIEKSEIRIMDPIAGDLKLEWDHDRTDEVDAAEKAFKAAQKKGTAFYCMKRDGSRGDKITDFDKYAERIIGIPAVVGG